jgi:hypothetical protein
VFVSDLFLTFAPVIALLAMSDRLTAPLCSWLGPTLFFGS